MILGDVNDFLLPNQACVNPFVGTTTEKTPNKGTMSESKHSSVIRLGMADITDLTTLEYEPDKPAANIINPKSKNDIKIASVSLTDCLACRYLLHGLSLFSLQNRNKIFYYSVLIHVCDLIILVVVSHLLRQFLFRSRAMKNF